MIAYHHTSARDQSRLDQFGKKILPRMFLVYELYAEGNLQRRQFLVADIEELDNLDASKIHAKEVITPKKWSTLHIPIADGTIKLSGGDQVFRKPTLVRDQPERGEEQKDDLRGESDGSQPLVTMTDGMELHVSSSR